MFNTFDNSNKHTTNKNELSEPDDEHIDIRDQDDLDDPVDNKGNH